MTQDDAPAPELDEFGFDPYEDLLDLDRPFPLVLYRHGPDGELMLPAAHVGALLRHAAETFRSWRTSGRVPLDLETTGRLYGGLLQHAADIDTAVADTARNGLPDPDTAASRARADRIAHELAEIADAWSAAGTP
ncbi:hypothetical protein [Kitasatospora phosalacinea]|uniref:Uncharacterized protein n=1 Tax=Kitasatospora phosalacinea TaxID=2065 RepID=A0A9W6PNL0_9ACTN|nr:hypothetical protein [Kitasatospora phosalacinea]GLW58081.1 hypothetical protein Kpho01_60920 [Kitasatospora phosalacinea]